MRWKRDLTSLDAVPDLDVGMRDKLVEHHITTAEELLGQIEAAPNSVGELLEISEPQVQDLGQRAHQVIDPAMSQAISAQRGRSYKTGALPPRDD